MLRPGDDINLHWEISGGRPKYRIVVRIYLDDRLLESHQAAPDDRSFLFIVPRCEER